MKRMCLSAVALVLLAGVGGASLLPTPGWDNDPYFTHQEWSFAADTNPSAPDDGGAGNRYGPATMTMSNAVWDGTTHVVAAGPGQLVGQFSGGWTISGPQADTQWFEIDLPNSANPNRTKEIWFEVIVSVNDFALAGDITNRVSFNVYADGIIDDAHKFTYTGEEGDALGVDIATNAVWLWFHGTFSYTPQPDSEKMVFVGSLDGGQIVALDQITVETRCVPEPATLCLLGVGVLALRRRRS